MKLKNSWSFFMNRLHEIRTNSDIIECNHTLGEMYLAKQCKCYSPFNQLMFWKNLINGYENLRNDSSFNNDEQPFIDEENLLVKNQGFQVEKAMINVVNRQTCIKYESYSPFIKLAIYTAVNAKLKKIII